jgi:hypothetical protein
MTTFSCRLFSAAQVERFKGDRPVSRKADTQLVVNRTEAFRSVVYQIF